MRRWALVWALGLPTCAWAWHDVKPVTDWSAHTLDDGEIRVGLFRAQYGLFEDLQVGTVVPIWAIRVKNFDAKWTAWRGGPWAVSVASALAWIRARDFGDEQPDVSLVILPIEATGSWQAGDFAAHLRLGFSMVRTVGSADSGGDEDVEFEGVAAISTFYASPTVEYRLSRVTALVAELHLGLFQELGGRGDITYRSEDGRTRVDLHAGGGADIAEGIPANVVVSAFWSWEVFQFKAGLGYGQYQVPMLNLFVDTDPVYFPEAALFWRW